MTSKGDASVVWARIDGNDSSLTEVTIGNDADASNRFEWKKTIDALKGNTHVTTVIVHVDSLSFSELVSLGVRLVSSGAIKTLILRDCDSPDNLLALLKIFTEAETLAVTYIRFDNASIRALNTQEVALEMKKVLSANRHVRRFDLPYGHHVEIESFKTICRGVRASCVNDLNLGALSAERVEYCRSLIQDGLQGSFAALFEHDVDLMLFGATIRGNSTLERLKVGFFNDVSTESIRQFLEIDLVTMKQLRHFWVNLQGYTDRRTFGALSGAVSGLETIAWLVLYADRLDQNVFTALTSSFSHLSYLEIIMDRRSNMQVNQGDGSSVDMLYDAFANNSSLSRLALPPAIFPPSTFPGLTRAVPTMTSLECLRLCDDDDDWKIANNQTSGILNMVKRSKTLTSIDCVYDDEVPESTKTEIEFHLQINYIRHEDFVKEAPLALWPRALAQVQKPQYKPLSLDLFYFLLRQRCDVLVPPGNSHKKRTVGEIE